MVPTSRPAAVEVVRAWGLMPVAAAALHLGGAVAGGGAGLEVLILDGSLAALWLGGRRLRPLARLALPLWATVVLYLDLQPALLPLRGEIHTGALFQLDARLFPAPGNIPWAAFFHGEGHTHPAADLAAGAAYALYLFQFGLALLVLGLLRPTDALRLAWSFFAVSAAGVAVYVLLPAAPPWYVLAHGFGPADLSAAPSAAGAARFDALLGIRWFENFYARNPNVFGAMPSLHAAYPTVAAFHLRRLGTGPGRAGAAFALWVAVSAVYLGHHYVLDVAAGVILALLVSAGTSAVLRASPRATQRGVS